MVLLECQTSFRRCEPGVGDMHEYCAATTLNPRPVIVTEHNNQIVEMVIPPQPLRVGGVR